MLDHEVQGSPVEPEIKVERKVKRSVVVSAATAPASGEAKPPVPYYYTSNSKFPLKVKDHKTGKVRVVNYGDRVPEAHDWPGHIQASNVRMGILNQVHTGT